LPTPRRFRSLAGDAEADQYAAGALDWVHEAGRPYFDWFFDGPATARLVLAEWLSRPSSEVFVGRAVVMLDGDEAIGGFMAMSGGELGRCRQADAVAALRATPRTSWPALKGRIEASGELFPPVEEDELYLSKMGVVRESRAKGLGRELVTEYLNSGRAGGFTRFRLDVWAGNEIAVGLYSACGFRVAQECRSAAAGMTYLAMTLVDDTSDVLSPAAKTPRRDSSQPPGRTFRSGL
jgi:ribosomal protein S18 acetylase RimI-like enzyme